MVRVWFFPISNQLCIKQHSEEWGGGEKTLKPEKKNWFTEIAKLVNGWLKHFQENKNIIKIKWKIPNF